MTTPTETPANLTAREAWLWLAEKWDVPTIDGNISPYVMMDNYRRTCLCGCIDVMKRSGVVAMTAADKMLGVINYARRNRTFLYELTPEGARQRAAFCRQQAALLTQPPAPPAPKPESPADKSESRMVKLENALRFARSRFCDPAALDRDPASRRLLELADGLVGAAPGMVYEPMKPESPAAGPVEPIIDRPDPHLCPRCLCGVCRCQPSKPADQPPPKPESPNPYAVTINGVTFDLYQLAHALGIAYLRNTLPELIARLELGDANFDKMIAMKTRAMLAEARLAALEAERDKLLRDAHHHDMATLGGYSAVPMPINAAGQGPCAESEAVRTEWQVWDACNLTVAVAVSEAAAKALVDRLNREPGTLGRGLTEESLAESLRDAWRGDCQLTETWDRLDAGSRQDWLRVAQEAITRLTGDQP